MKHFKRQEQEDREVFLKQQGWVSPEFTLSCESKGRKNPDDEDPDEEDWRTAFQRDYDRIAWCDARTRLKDKTQVALLPRDPHLTTRLIHAGEVTRLTIGLCRYVGYNPDLGGAQAEGHDLGHTPFGHAGEKTLTKIMREILGDDKYIFHHAAYGLEIVDRIEKKNLTDEVRDGIRWHSRGSESVGGKRREPYTPEGKCMMWADKFAYTASDIEDALRVGMIQESDLYKDKKVRSALRILGCSDSYDKSDLLDALIPGFVYSTLEHQQVCFVGEKSEAFEVLKKWMYDNVYGSSKMEAEFKKAKDMMQIVFSRIMKHEFSHLEDKEAAYATLDRVACMTDRSIVLYFEDSYIPKGVY
ncbi:HD domain-containing protein [Nanoarchaeota archaeon]